MYELPRTLGPALWIGGLLYRAAVVTRNRLYSSGVLSTRRVPSPVLSVGNLTLGGTGKTPLVLHIARLVLDLGFTPVLLSRGYGGRGRTKPCVVAPGPDSGDLAREVGDEPALLRRRCPEMWLAIDGDRYRAARAVEGCCARPVFLMDDGFQHRALHRDFDIVVIDATQPFETNRVLPQGSLRESPPALRRADAVVVNGESAFPAVKRWMAPGALLFACTQEIERTVPFAAWVACEAGDFPVRRNLRFFLAAAVGNPERFRRDAIRAGIDVRGARSFRDHHWICPAEWENCRSEAVSAGAEALLTTEKDAVKMAEPPGFPLFVAVQGMRMDDPVGFEATVAKVVGMRA